MNKAKVGDKFIIEIADVINGGETGCPQYRVKGFDKVFFDDKGLGNLEKYSDDFDAACKIGAEAVWKMAHDIMELPIQKRSEIFKISHNQASFKDLSSKFDVYEAAALYYGNAEDDKKQIRKQEIESKLAEFAEQNGYTLTELKMASKSLLKQKR